MRRYISDGSKDVDEAEDEPVIVLDISWTIMGGTEIMCTAVSFRTSSYYHQLHM